MTDLPHYIRRNANLPPSPTPFFSSPNLYLTLQATPDENLVLAVEAMRLHPELWQRYFDDFLQHKLQLKGLHSGGISQRLRHVLFQQLNKQDAISCVVSLHCYSHVDLAKMADLLQPLNQIQQVGRCSDDVHLCPCVHALHRKATFSVLQTTTVEFPLLASTPDGEHLAKATQAQNLLGTPECIATFVVNTLFAAIVEVTNVSVTTVPEKMTVWFKAYRYMSVVISLECSDMPYLNAWMHTALPLPPPPMHTQRLDDFINSEEECL